MNSGTPLFYVGILKRFFWKTKVCLNIVFVRTNLRGRFATMPNGFPIDDIDAFSAESIDFHAFFSIESETLSA